MPTVDEEHDLTVGLLQHSKVAVQVYRADLRCALVNPAFVELFGEQPLDQYDLSEHYVAGPGTLEEAIRRAVAGETVRLPPDWYDLPGRTPSEGRDPRRVAFAATAFPVQNGSGVRGAAVCYADVTAERNLRSVADALELSRQQFRATFEQAAVGIAHVAPDGRWLNVNRKLCEIVGYARQELLALTFQDITHPDDLNGDLAYVQSLLADEISTYSMDKRYVRADGEIVWVELTVSLVRDDAGSPRYFISVVHDISARRAAEQAKASALDAMKKESAERARAEARLRETEEQLRHSQKMETIGRLAGTVAHDFNNLISVIGSYAELIARGLRPQDPIRGDLDEIMTAGRRAGELTHQLLAFSRQQILQPRVIDLNQAISTTVKMLRRLVGDQIDVLFSPSPGLPKVFVDASQLEQVLLNLVVNAKDAMPLGGKLTLETGELEFDLAVSPKRLQLSNGRYALFRITDTGVGIEKTVQERIFEPFFTTKERGQGTGLGLSTVFGIVKQSGGCVWMHSVVGIGTSFEIYLPIAAHTPAVERPISPSAVPVGGSETILLSEDDQQVRTLARTILRRHGYNVLDAANGVDALSESERYEGTIHLLLADLVMPRMTGIELWEKISRSRSDMNVLFMSGYSGDSADRTRILPSNFDFIDKPLMLEPLLAKVREVLDRKR